MHRLTEFSLRWPRLVLLIALAAAALSANSVRKLPLSAGAYAYIGEHHPVVQQFEEFIRDFGGYALVIAWHCGGPTDPCTSVVDPASIAMAKQVGDSLLASPHVARISSPAHTPLLIETAEGIELVRLGGNHRWTPEELSRLALADPDWVGSLVSADGSLAALIAEMSHTAPEDQFALVSDAEAALQQPRAAGFQFFFSGAPWIQVALYDSSLSDGIAVGALVGLIVGACFFALLRSWQSVVAVLVPLALVSICSFSVLAIFGWSRDPVSTGAPILVLVMGSADAVHLLTAYWGRRAAGDDRISGLVAAAHETQAPSVMTALTNAAGLLSFLAAESPAVGHFGVVAAAGVAIALLFTFSLIPAFLVLLPDRPKDAAPEVERWNNLLSRVLSIPMIHPKPVLAVASVITALGAFGLTRLEAAQDPLGMWKSGHPTRTAIERVSKELAPLDGIDIVLSVPDAAYDGATLAELEELRRELARDESSRSVRSLSSVLDRLASAFGAQDDSWDAKGDLLGFATLAGSDLASWVSIDLRRVRVSASTIPMTPRERRLYAERAEEIVNSSPWAENALITGPTTLQLAISDVIENTAWSTVSVSTLLVSLLVMVYLRSIRWGALAMIPNIVPLVVLFGLMGIWGISLDGGSAMVAPIAIGIAVDDTIHILHVYAGLRRRGLEPVAAICQATLSVGRAIVTTSCALALGFAAMLSSQFQSVANIGLLSAAAILAAMAAEILVLPALLVVTSQYRRRSVLG
jgi:hypothetical protein